MCVAPFEIIAFDILGPLPVTSKGHRYILVIMDYFTKLPQDEPLADQEASTIAEALLEKWVLRFGVPLILYLDQGGGSHDSSSDIDECSNSIKFTTPKKKKGKIKSKKAKKDASQDNNEQLDHTHVTQMFFARNVQKTTTKLRGSVIGFVASFVKCGYMKTVLFSTLFV
ncbi:hypothetical protein AVEN_128062-1 [Araneus ventricosus]|uniref:Integrase catalytic domain-containing protein n=1 Tax=Araneus ventricosus TaxID=182803 RepID=A0A4Y2A0N7_ARAVE|nr:hypothetical protein AVEN_128062-1 [Araneus ventricosus]